MAWERPGNDLGTAWERPGNGLGTTWERPGNGLGTAWERPGNGLGTAWERPGNGLGTRLGKSMLYIYARLYAHSLGPSPTPTFHHHISMGRDYSFTSAFSVYDLL